MISYEYDAGEQELLIGTPVFVTIHMDIYDVVQDSIEAGPIRWEVTYENGKTEDFDHDAAAKIFGPQTFARISVDSIQDMAERFAYDKSMEGVDEYIDLRKEQQ